MKIDATLVIIVFLIQLQCIVISRADLEASCDWRARSNLYAIRAILENIIRSNDTLLYELAGIFSNKQRPLRQLIVHYSIQIPLNDECSTTDLDCNLQHHNTGGNCPDGYSCIRTDFIWGRYPATAQDLIFRDLDACPLVIGGYQQREVDIHFTLKSPPSCNASIINLDSIDREEFPCGWQCFERSIINPSSGDPNEALVRSVERESPLDEALNRITTKLLQYSTDKEALPSLQYDVNEVAGYAAKLDDVTYFNAPVEYSIFLLGYILFHAIVFMLIVHYRLELYEGIYNYATENHVNFSLFWSGIVTFILFCFNISFVFAVEGGICITLLQLYIAAISVAPCLFYPFVAIFMIKRKVGFFNATLENIQPICVKIPLLDHSVQIIIMWFTYTGPHIIILLIILTAISFFFDSDGTTFLILYFACSSVILWIANAIVIFLMTRIFSCSEKPFVAVKRVVFAICLGLSVNLMNFSVIPFIGDFFYDKRANGSTVFSLIPLAITCIGWYLSGDLVEGFSALPFTDSMTKEKEESAFKTRIVNRLTLKGVRKKKGEDAEAQFHELDEIDNGGEGNCADSMARRNHKERQRPSSMVEMESSA